MKLFSKLITALFLVFHFSVQSQTIVDIVVNSPDHNTLETAVITADLAGTLSGTGPFTLFAPTDAAFAALDPDVLAAVLADPDGALTQILTTHAVNGVADGSSIFDGLTIGSLSGENLSFGISGASITVNGVNISVVDIKATNGVVHVIDAVILPEMQASSVVDIIVNSPDHNTLETAVLAAGLETALSGAGPFTVFAPTDAAFAAVDPATLNALLADPQGALTTVLTYHAVSGVAESSIISNGLKLGTLQGQNIEFSVNGNSAFVNDVLISVADIKAENGIVHVIDAVLLPTMKSASVVDIIVNSPDHNTLETAVLAAGLETALSGAGPFTVFAPTDAAFAAVDPATLNALLADPQGALTNVLTYHAMSGVAESGIISDGLLLSTLQGTNVSFSVTANGVFINDAQITVTDIRAENGIVHVIDAVLVPATSTSTTNPRPASVVDIIVNSPDHNTLETAVLAAGLETALSSTGPFTIFAPTDAAFAAVDPATLNALLADPQGALTEVLTYHAINGVAEADIITDGLKMGTLQGTNVTFSITANGVFINDAQITVTDLKADNGVVHVIDAVLIP